MKTATVYLYAPGSRNDAIRTYTEVPEESLNRIERTLIFITKEGQRVRTSLEYIVQED